jgi:soluble lytic murein transglycosylase
MTFIAQRTALALGLAAYAATAATMAPITSPKAPPAPALALPSTDAVSSAPAAAPAAMPISGVSDALARWKLLRNSTGLPFSAYASFLISFPGWPGQLALRRNAERAIEPSTSSPSEVIAYFSVHPPLTANGHAARALALLALTKADEARESARRAWHAGAMPRHVEAQLLGSFGTALSPADHDRRIDRLLTDGQTGAALQMIALGSTARRAAFEARIALQSNAADAAARVASLGGAASADPGLVLDQAGWLRRAGQSAAARALLAQPRTLSTSPGDPKKWLETLLSTARSAAADNDWLTSYQIARQLDGIYPAESRIGDQPLAERDDYTSLAWLAATTALDKLNRPADAALLFEKYARGGRSGQVLTKGYYWAGRAALSAREAGQANSYFEQAAAYPELFYGQLSLERLGRPVPAPADLTAVPVSEGERAALQLIPRCRYRLLRIPTGRSPMASFVRKARLTVQR